MAADFGALTTESMLQLQKDKALMLGKCLKELNIAKHYATNRNNLVSEFYSPCILRSTRYDRAVGYFRNSVMLLVGRSIASFAQNGGTIRLVCSPDLTEDEVRAFQSGYEWRGAVDKAILRIVESALANAYERPAWQFVATLVARENLDIRIAFKPGHWGIFHDKLGLFYDDDGHVVSFIGSCNETASAWDPFGNHESFEVFSSWTADSARVNEHRSYFDRLWQNHEPGIETIPFPEVARDRLRIASNPAGPEAALENVMLPDVAKSIKAPQAYQTRAMNAWKNNGCRGIIAHATGSGKTFTALLTIQQWLQERGPVLVLLPSELLVDQWYSEIQDVLRSENPTVMRVGGGFSSWKRPYVVEGFTQRAGNPRIILATIQTASEELFLNRVTQGDHLLAIWDEVHWAGAPKYSSTLTISTGGRMGLSATPKRYGDPVGTQKLLEYFGGVVDVVTLADAIEAGRLCHYNYYVHPTELFEDEREEWQKLSFEIRRAFARSNLEDGGLSQLPEYIKHLLIKRSRIPKKARSKIELAANIIEKLFVEGSRWLVYCEDKEQMSSVAESIRRKGISCSEFHSEMAADRSSTLTRFDELGGILVAIKCLDEGVDIPSASHSLILASSRNPREFIQRRGRILRKSPGKHFAEIHDALIIPPQEEDSAEPPEANILKTELARALRFAQSAANYSSIYSLYEIADKAAIKNVEQLADSGFEEDLNGE